MKVVLDANVFIAAFLKGPIVREILSSDKYEFFMPEYALGERGMRPLGKRIYTLKRGK